MREKPPRVPLGWWIWEGLAVISQRGQETRAERRAVHALEVFLALPLLIHIRYYLWGFEPNPLHVSINERHSAETQHLCW